MKFIPYKLVSHIAGEVTSISNLWKMTRKDGVILGFTDFDEDLTYNGMMYAASSGFTPTAIQTTGDLAVDNLEVAGMLSSASITESDIVAGKYDYAAIELNQINNQSPEDGIIKMRKGYLGEIRIGNGSFHAELRGMMQLLQQDLGRVYGPQCDADFGDKRCKLKLNNESVSGSVTGVAGGRRFSAAAWIPPSNLLSYGKITLVGSAPAQVKSVVGTNFILTDKPASALVASAPFMIDVTTGINGKITSIAGEAQFVDAALTVQPGQYVFTTVTWKTGLNALTTSDVTLYTTGNVTLQYKTKQPLSVGDEYTISATKSYTGWISSVPTNSAFEASSLTSTQNTFSGAVVAWKSGLNSGTESFVADYAPGAVELAVAPDHVIAAGDAYTMTTSRTATCSITSIESNRVFSDAGRIDAEGHFSFGKATFTSGANAGVSVEIKTFASSLFELQQSAPHPLAIGDLFTASQGCDKLITTCNKRYGNESNFRGFNLIPGPDRMISGG